MRRLLNVVYVSQPDVYLALKGNNLNLIKDGESIGRVPLHNLEGICTFGYQGASPALMHKCMEENIGISFFFANWSVTWSCNRNDKWQCNLEENSIPKIRK